MLIIGGTGKIGRELVRYFSKRERVTFTFFSNESFAKKLAQETGSECIFLDLSHPDETFLNLLPKMNLNKVIFTGGQLQKTTIQNFVELDNLIKINLTGPAFLAEKLASFGISRILFITDINGVIPYSRFWINSIASAGIFMLIKTLARKYSPETLINGLAINAIKEPFPGYVPNLPMKRLPQIEEIVKTVDFLMYGNSYITGQIFLMDGGRTLI